MILVQALSRLFQEFSDLGATITRITGHFRAICYTFKLETEEALIIVQQVAFV